MKKLFSFIITLFIAITAIQSNVIYAPQQRTAQKRTPIKRSQRKRTIAQNLSTQTVEKAETENDDLSVVTNNALNLVLFIEKNNHNPADHKKATAAIDKAFKNLPESTQQAIENDINTIKEESRLFLETQHKPLQKYNISAAESAFSHLTHTLSNLNEDRSEKVVAQALQQVNTTMNATERTIFEAQTMIDQTRNKLAAGLITEVEAAKIIGEHSYKINVAERNLKKEITQAQKDVEQSNAQAGYFRRFTSGVYAYGSSALAPFKAGYGYSDEEKEIARAIIVELETQLKLTIDRYKVAFTQAATAQERIILQQAFELTTRAIADELYQQKIITGEAMSTNRKLFWGTMAAAGVLAAGYLGYQHLITEPSSVVSQPNTPVVPVATEPTEPEIPASIPTVDQPEISDVTPVVTQEEMSTLTNNIPDQGPEPDQGTSELFVGSSTLNVETPYKDIVPTQPDEMVAKPTTITNELAKTPEELQLDEIEQQIQQEEAEQKRQKELQEELQTSDHPWGAEETDEIVAPETAEAVFVPEEEEKPEISMEPITNIPTDEETIVQEITNVEEPVNNLTGTGQSTTEKEIPAVEEEVALPLSEDLPEAQAFSPTIEQDIVPSSEQDSATPKFTTEPLEFPAPGTPPAEIIPLEDIYNVPKQQAMEKYGLIPSSPEIKALEEEKLDWQNLHEKASNSVNELKQELRNPNLSKQNKKQKEKELSTAVQLAENAENKIGDLDYEIEAKKKAQVKKTVETLESVKKDQELFVKALEEEQDNIKELLTDPNLPLKEKKSLEDKYKDNSTKITKVNTDMHNSELALLGLITAGAITAAVVASPEDDQNQQGQAGQQGTPTNP